MADRADFAAAVRALAAEDRARAGDHPEAEAIAAYAAGTLPAARAEALRGHLAVCPECADLVLEYAEFAPAPAADAAREREIAAAYRAARRRLGLPAESPAEVHRQEGSRRPRMPWRLAAAAALLAAIGLGFWGWGEHRALGAARAPRLNVAAVDLDPQGSDQVRGEHPARRLDLAAGATLFLSLADLPDDGELRVVIADPRGREVWALGGARRDPVLGNLSLHLPPASLVPGSYEIRVYAGAGDSLLAVYPIDVD